MDEQNKTVPWRGDTKELCGVIRTNCLRSYAQHRVQLERLSRDNRLRLARYRAWYRYPGFSDRMLNRVATAYPNFGGAEHETVLGQIAIRAVDGNAEGALRDLVADVQFWRRVLAGSGTMVTKVVATSFLSRDYALASEIAAKYKGQANLIARLVPMTTPLTPEERDWTKVINGEFQWQAYLDAALAKESVEPEVFVRSGTINDRLYDTVLYRPNASINQSFRYFDSLQIMAAAPGYNLIDKANELNHNFAKLEDIFRLDMVYNPVGKILVAVGAPSPTDIAKYIARGHNLDGAIRLLTLQLDIYRRKVPLSHIENFVAKAPDGLFQPYQHRAMEWDSANHELWFWGVDPHGKGRLAADMHITIRLYPSSRD